jgi:hypothetical protein
LKAIAKRYLYPRVKRKSAGKKTTLATLLLIFATYAAAATEPNQADHAITIHVGSSGPSSME